MGADDQADLLSVWATISGILMDALRPAEAVEVEGLMTYEPDTAGGIMSPEYFALPSHTTAAEAIAALQRSDDVEMAFYVYVINDPGHLVGVVSLRALVIHPPDTHLADLMVSDVISAGVGTDQEEVARLAPATISWRFRWSMMAISWWAL